MVPTVVPATLVKCSGGLVSCLRVEMAARAAVFRRQLGQAEVEHLHRPAARQEDVGRLDVAMQDAFGVRRVERVGDLRRDVEHQPADRAAVPTAGDRAARRRAAPSRDRAGLRVRRSRRSCRCSGDSATTRCAPRGGSARSLPRSAVLPVGRTLSATCRPELQCPARDRRRPSRPRRAGPGSCSAREFVQPKKSPQCGRSSYACNALTGKGANGRVRNLKRRSA